MLTLLFATCAFAVITQVWSPKCKDVMQKAGATPLFPRDVAHGIHCLTVDDIRYYFEKNVTEKNRIPTVNLDLTSSKPILLSAPVGDESKFATVALRVVDRVLSHMDNPHFDIAEFTPLERLVHSLHMHEVWTHTAVYYKNLKTNPPSNIRTVCSCALDIENNDVLRMLQLVALKIREPALVYHRRVSMGEESYLWDGKRRLYFFTRPPSEEEGEDPEQPHLEAERDWGVWRDHMLNDMPVENHKDLALFLYCALEDGKDTAVKNGNAMFSN